MEIVAIIIVVAHWQGALVCLLCLLFIVITIAIMLNAVHLLR